DDVGYDISLTLKLYTIKSMFEKVGAQMLLGWWWGVDPGNNEYTLQAPSSVPQHTFFAGKDILKLKIKKDISNLVNDLYFVGGTINEAQDTLTIQTTDVPSIQQYRRGLNTLSDGR